MELIWGVLKTKHTSLTNVYLGKPMLRFGKEQEQGVTIVLPEEYAKLVSRTHFEISRDLSGFQQNQQNHQPVVLTDCSVHGTYVNNELVGTGEKRILMTGDVISILDQRIELFEFNDFLHIRTMDEKIDNKYFVCRSEIGAGSYGTVFKAFELRTTKPMAIKRIAKNPFDKLQPKNEVEFEKIAKEIANEVRIMESVKHPCIVELFDVLETSDHVYIIMDYMAGGTLADRLHDKIVLKEHTAMVFFVQIARAIEHLHGLSIVHRDLKPANLLLASKDEHTRLKVTDFGISKIEQGTQLRTRIGTTMYVFFVCSEIYL